MFEYPLEVNGARVMLESGQPVKVDSEKFNICTECGEQLIEGQDGFGTIHGTCDNCVWCESD